MTVAPINTAILSHTSFRNPNGKSSSDSDLDNEFGMVLEGWRKTLPIEERGSFEKAPDPQTEDTDGTQNPVNKEGLNFTPLIGFRPDAISNDCGLQEAFLPSNLDVASRNATGKTIYTLSVSDGDGLGIASNLVETSEVVQQASISTTDSEILHLSTPFLVKDIDTVGVDKSGSRLQEDAELQQEKRMIVSGVNQSDEPSEKSPVAQILTLISSVPPPSTEQSVMFTSRNYTYNQLEFHHSTVRQLRFMLQPETLGEVEVAIRRTGSDTTVTISVGSRSAADAIVRDMVFLEDRLGSLLSSGGVGSVSIAMEIRSPEADFRSASHLEGNQLSNGATYSEGRGFDRDNRSGAHDRRSYSRLVEQATQQPDTSTESRTGDSRVV
jgi:hypothetical protein